MKKFDGIKEDNEYFFFFKDYFCTGFFVSLNENVMKIKNGSFIFVNCKEAKDEMICPYGEASIDTSYIIGFAST